PLSRQSGERGIEISTLYNLAKAEKAVGALQEAMKSAKSAIEIIERLRSNVGSPDFRLSYFSEQRQYYDLNIDLLMQLDQAQPGEGFAATALVVSENARARSLCDLLRESGANIRQGVPAEILKRENELRTQLRVIAQSQLRLRLNNETIARDAGA